MIVVPLIENFILIMIIKICDEFFENKEIISGILIAFLAGFGHIYYWAGFFTVFVMSYQYVNYRRNITKFYAYMCTVIVHATLNFFGVLLQFSI